MGLFFYSNYINHSKLTKVFFFFLIRSGYLHVGLLSETQAYPSDVFIIIIILSGNRVRQSKNKTMPRANEKERGWGAKNWVGSGTNWPTDIV